MTLFKADARAGGDRILEVPRGVGIFRWVSWNLIYTAAAAAAAAAAAFFFFFLLRAAAAAFIIVTRIL